MPPPTAIATRTDDEDTTATAQRSQRWRPTLIRAGVIWLVAHLFYLTVMLLAAMMANKKAGLSEQWPAWQRWDATWFARITEFGYTGLPANGISPATAFFPLFPLLSAIVNPIVPGGPYIADAVVANLAYLGALVLLLRLFQHESDTATSTRASWYLVAFPTAFFLAAGYNTSMELLLAVGALYAMRRQRWWLAGLLGALASANRSSGVLLLVPFVYEYLRVREFQWRRIRADVLWAALVPAGLVAYMVYTWVTLHDALRFMHAQDNWKRTMDWPWVTLWDAVRLSVKHPTRFDAFQIHNMLDLSGVIFAGALLVLSFVGPWKLRRDQWALPLYGIASLVFIMIFPNFSAAHPAPLQSATRLVLEVFPVFLIMAKIGRRETADRTYLMLAGAAQALLLLVFLHGDWVA